MIHIAQLDYTVKTLQKLYANELAGKVFFAANDPYSLGPLTNYSARLAFWQALSLDPFMAENDSDSDGSLCAPFLQEVKDLLQQNVSLPIFLWDGGTCDEAILLRMLCHALDGMSANLRVVKVAPYKGQSALVDHPPKMLSEALDGAKPVSQREIGKLARQFGRLQNSASLLRGKTAEGKLVDLNLNAYDDYILAGCSAEWKPALRVVGEALARCDAQNPVGDVFFISRLATLLEERRIESHSPLIGIRQLQVRLRH